MWIILWNSFLIKVLLKKEAMKPTRISQKCWNMLPKKKRVKRIHNKFSTIQMHIFGPFGLNLFLLKLKIENWNHCSKIIFKCVNSVMEPIFNIFKYVNSTATVRKQWFLSFHSKFMWFYCLCAEKKKKKRRRRRAKCAIQTVT